MRCLVLAICLLMLPMGQEAYACVASPEEYYVHHRDLVAESDRIAIVRVVGSSANNHDAELITHDWLSESAETQALFEPIRVLKGDIPARFKISGGRLISADLDPVRDMDGHRNIGFWTKRSTQTRTFHDTDCRMSPGFVLGRIYLVFLDRPHLKAYEEIRSKEDLWLQAVQHMIDNPSAQAGISLPVEDWLQMVTGVFKGSVWSCDGPVLWVGDVLKGTFPNFLGVHYWWRYQEDNPSGHWNAGPCEDGGDYLVMTTYPEEQRLPYRESIVVPVQDDVADFRVPIEMSEIPIEGDHRIPLSELRKIYGTPE